MSEGKEIVLSIDGVEIGRSISHKFKPFSNIQEVEIKTYKDTKNPKKIAAYFHDTMGSIDDKPVRLIVKPQYYFDNGKRYLRFKRTSK